MKHKIKKVLKKQNDLAIATAVAIVICVSGGYLVLVAASGHLGESRVTASIEHFAAQFSAGKRERLPLPLIMPQQIPNAQNLDLNETGAAVIIDIESGEILFEKNANQKRAVASTTKMLTAMIVVDTADDLQEYIPVTEAVIEIEGSRVGCKTSYNCQSERLEVGERVRIADLVKAMLIASANDAATLLALHVAGSEEGFAQLMNKRMDDLGLGETIFCRPSGLELDDPEAEAKCHSSARDIGRVTAVIASQEKYKPIMEALTTTRTSFFSESGTIEHIVETTNDTIEASELVIGGKTGFTPRAGRALANIGRDKGGQHPLVTVVLDDEQRFETSLKMLEWAYENHTWQETLGTRTK